MHVHADADQRRYLLDALAPLVNGTIEKVGTAFVGDLAYGPSLTIRTPGGQRVVAEVWADEEGNGPGHVAFTKVSKTIPFTPINHDAVPELIRRTHVMERLLRACLATIESGDSDARTPDTQHIDDLGSAIREMLDGRKR